MFIFGEIGTSINLFRLPFNTEVYILGSFSSREPPILGLNATNNSFYGMGDTCIVTAGICILRGEALVNTVERFGRLNGGMKKPVGVMMAWF